jgi:ATP-dependent RNA helicase DOB1
LHKSPALPRLFEQYSARQGLDERISTLKRNIRDTNAIVCMDELKNRGRVLRRLNYTTEAGVIEVKGRVACEISTGDELLLTELMFAGAFNDLTPEQTAALLSCFVCQEKSDDPPKLREELAAPLRMMREAARRVAKVSIECKIELNEDEYIESFRSELMDVVFAWCRGVKFAKICKMTEIYEGSIIRCMRRLEELLRQMAQAAKSIGNTDLETKFNDGIAKLKRDIVFANSLYL